MADSFLSYSRQDKEAVTPIVAGLEAESFSVWWDRNVQPGEEFQKVIERELIAAPCVAVVWSALSVASKWVGSEAALGYVSAAMILLIGAALWGGSQAITALQPAPLDTAPTAAD